MVPKHAFKRYKKVTGFKNPSESISTFEKSQFYNKELDYRERRCMQKVAPKTSEGKQKFSSHVVQWLQQSDRGSFCFLLTVMVMHLFHQLNIYYEHRRLSSCGCCVSEIFQYNFSFQFKPFMKKEDPVCGGDVLVVHFFFLCEQNRNEISYLAIPYHKRCHWSIFCKSKCHWSHHSQMCYNTREALEIAFNSSNIKLSKNFRCFTAIYSSGEAVFSSGSYLF